MDIRGILALAILFGMVSSGIPASAQPAGDEQLTMLKESLQKGLAQIRSYQWVETTTVSHKGEAKTTKQNRCYYGADGKVQKELISQEGGGGKSPRGVRGKIVDKKKGEMEEYMTDAVALVKQYVPPDPARIQALKDAGNLSVNPKPDGQVQLDLSGYAKDGDLLSILFDPAKNMLKGLSVSSYLKKPDDAVTLDVDMATLADGALYPAEIKLDGKAKKIAVDIKNGGHELR